MAPRPTGIARHIARDDLGRREHLPLGKRKPVQRRPQPGLVGIQRETRLLQILITEACHLIWVLRCDRVINQENHSVQQIKNRWLKVINKRLTTDKITATKLKRDKGTKGLVDATWKKALRKQGKQLTNWMQNKEVFSGY